MLMEILENNSGFLYTNKPLQDTMNIDCEIIDEEIVNNIHVYKIKLIENIHLLTQKDNLELKCKHNKRIDYQSVNYLPSEYWEDLIECWSCHNNEFARVKDLQIKVRNHGVLISHFFFLIRNVDLPVCCRDNSLEIRKIWFNELNDTNHRKLVYDYLIQYFQSNNVFILEYKDEVYEMKYFYKLKYLIKEYVSANCMKIGIRKINKCKVEVGEYINKFYMEYIYEMIEYIGIKVLEYDTGFIYH